MNTTANLRRIHHEVQQIEKQAQEYEKMFKITMVGDNIYHWQATIYGPEDSLYEGYQFKVDIQLPNNYPYAPMTVKFITPIKHVNVNSKGDICLDILKNNWSASQNIHSVLLSVGLLLSQPNTEDPLDGDLAELYRTNKKEYAKKIKTFCKESAIKN